MPIQELDPNSIDFRLMILKINELVVAVNAIIVLPSASSPPPITRASEG